MVHIDFIFAHQKLDALGGLVHNALFTGDHLFQIDLYLSRNFNAVFFEMLYGIFIMVGRVQQCLGRDTSHIKASTAQGCIFFYYGRFHSQLGTTNGRHIASWS